jgi:hypothetical protein
LIRPTVELYLRGAKLLASVYQNLIRGEYTPTREKRMIMCDIWVSDMVTPRTLVRKNRIGW